MPSARVPNTRGLTIAPHFRHPSGYSVASITARRFTENHSPVAACGVPDPHQWSRVAADSYSTTHAPATTNLLTAASLQLTVFSHPGPVLNGSAPSSVTTSSLAVPDLLTTLQDTLSRRVARLNVDQDMVHHLSDIAARGAELEMAADHADHDLAEVNQQWDHACQELTLRLQEHAALDQLDSSVLQQALSVDKLEDEEEGDQNNEEPLEDGFAYPKDFDDPDDKGQGGAGSYHGSGGNTDSPESQDDNYDSPNQDNEDGDCNDPSSDAWDSCVDVTDSPALGAPLALSFTVGGLTILSPLVILLASGFTPWLALPYPRHGRTWGPGGALISFLTFHSLLTRWMGHWMFLWSLRQHFPLLFVKLHGSHQPFWTACHIWPLPALRGVLPSSSSQHSS